MIRTKVNNTFKELNIINYKSSNEYTNFLICADINNYKKGLRTALKLYNSFNFDTLIFKVEFPFSEENLFNNLENTLNKLNRFMDICKLKKPLNMKKTLYKDNNNLKELITFYWDLSTENIKVKTLFKEMLFLKNDGFSALFSSIFFLDTKNHILFNFYDDKIIKILANDNACFNKICKKYKKLIII